MYQGTELDEQMGKNLALWNIFINNYMSKTLQKFALLDHFSRL